MTTTLPRLAAALMLMVSTSAAGQRLKPGQLLFHVAAQSNAITDVTPGMTDHVAIVISPDSVIEATHRGVVVTPVDSLRTDGYFLVARVARRIDLRQTLSNARSYLGRPYDFVFLPTNDDIYCSELVQLSFVDRRGRRVFPTVPMSFHDATGRITPYWQQYYAERGLAVPEGQSGTNPGELSRRPAIRIVGRLKR